MFNQFLKPNKLIPEGSLVIARIRQWYVREVPWRKIQYTGGDNPGYAQTCGQPRAGEVQELAKGTSREVRGQEVTEQDKDWA